MALMRRTRTGFEWPERLFDRWSDWADLPDWPADEHMPKVEEYQDGETMVVRAEMPGLDPDQDVEITVTDGTLRITAERRQETRVEEKKGFRSEFHYGAFGRTLSLPAGVTEEDITASYHDGILEVRLPIDRGQAEARKIPVARS
jgi:HSP20 family protein